MFPCLYCYINVNCINYLDFFPSSYPRPLLHGFAIFLSRGEVFSLPLESEFRHVTSFVQWDVNKCDTSGDLKKQALLKLGLCSCASAIAIKLQAQYSLLVPGSGWETHEPEASWPGRDQPGLVYPQMIFRLMCEPYVDKLKSTDTWQMFTVV